jgi:hypothetical protein
MIMTPALARLTGRSPAPVLVEIDPRTDGGKDEVDR